MARDMIILLAVLFLCFILVYLILFFKLHFIPECLITIGIGCIFGILMKIFPFNADVITQMDPQIFFVIFLPAIIFDAGYSMQKVDFFKNIGSIILFAIFGTFLSTVVVAVGLYGFSTIGWIVLGGEKLPIVDSFMFGALICAVDPVATLAIFKALNVNATLHYLVFGESIVNDAIAIVLFETFKMFKEEGEDTTTIVFKGISKFLLDSCGSVLLGAAIALFGAFFFKMLHLRTMPHLEIVFFFTFAYLPYLIALPYLSGIVTVLTTSVIMSYYVQNNLSKNTQHALEYIFHSLGFFSESFVFLYMGMALFAFDLKWNFPFIILTLVLIIIARAVNTFPLSSIANTYRKRKISLKNQLIMWVSGLRGAIAFALAIELREEDGTILGEYIFTTTLIIVLITIVFFGGGTWPILKLFKVKSNNENEPQAHQTEAAKKDPALALPSSLDTRSKKNILVRFDEKVLRRFFLKKDVYQNMQRQAEEMHREAVHEGNDSEGAQSAVEIEIPDTQPLGDEQLDDLISRITQVDPEQRQRLRSALENIEQEESGEV